MRQVKTLILRFRDLGMGPDKTIDTHKSMITTNGYVWWGWWSKSGEQIPLEVFSDLVTQAESAGLPVYLFDTGHGKLYRAQCTAIEFKTSKAKRGSPEPDKTPDYYNKEQFPAWFKLSDIQETEFAKVKLSYVEVPDFFTDATNNFQDFDGKRVSSARELKQQDRSVWFVRDAEKGDPTYEIRLKDTNIKPAPFIQQFVSSEESKLLWVSDLHFGTLHGFPNDPEGPRRPLWLAIEHACTDLEIDNIAGVIASGDISSYGTKEGFDKAYDSFFVNLSSKYKLSHYNWVVCPGNHDFAFSDVEVAPDVQIPKPTETATEAYSEFHNKLFHISPNEDYSSGRRFLLNNKYAVEIVALSTVNLAQKGGIFQGFGYVGDDQLRRAEQMFNWNKETNDHATRIVVLHHHLLPITYTENTTWNSRYSLSLDSEAIIRWLLKHNVKLVLHGHMHQPSIVKIKRPVSISDKAANTDEWPEVTICSLGSTGVKQDSLGETRYNMFGVITLANEQLKLEMFKLDPTIRTNNSESIFSTCIPL